MTNEEEINRGANGADTEPFWTDELRGCLATGTKGLIPKCLIHDRDTCVTCEENRQWRRLM